LYRSLVVGCVAVLALHGLAGHAHADSLAPVPLTSHVAGDAHHEGAGACEGAQGAAWMGAVEALPGAPSTPAVTAGSRSVSLDQPHEIPRPPRFLLHAALLI
jgi:hypothetical protein